MSLNYLNPDGMKLHQKRVLLRSGFRAGLVLILVFTFLGMFGVWYATRLGPGVGGDATIYLTSARNLITGQGLGYWEAENTFRLLPYFPPFFPFVLGIIGALKIPMVGGARGLHILLFGATILFSGLLFYRYSRSTWLSVLLSAVIAFSPILSFVFMWVMAEPIYLFAGILCVWFLLRYLETTHKGWLLFAALSAGISFFARYLGISFVLLGTFAVLLMTGEHLFRKIRDLAIFLLISCTPIVLWATYDRLFTGTISSRSVVAGGALPGQLTSLVNGIYEVVASWFIPFSWISAPPYPAEMNPVLLAVLLVSVVISALVLFYHQIKKPLKLISGAEARLWVLMVVLIFLNTGTIMVVYILTYPPITLDNRMFSAAYLAMVFLLFAQGALVLRTWPSKKWLKVAVYMIFAFFLATYLYRTPRTILQIHEDGLGYNSSIWQASDTIQAVKRLPEGLPVVTNDVAALMYFTDVRPYPLSEIYLAQPLPIFTRFGEDPNDPAQQAFREGAALVLFDSLEDELRFLYGARTGERIAHLTQGLYIHYRGSDGTIYFHHPPADDQSRP